MSTAGAERHRAGPAAGTSSGPEPDTSDRSRGGRPADDRQRGSRAYLGIGEVLARLRPDFPDITISKIRFLEAEGLVEPRRSASGYRKFSRADVGRLQYVLGAQRDRYLPLRVIKEQLEAIDRGLEPAPPGDPTGPQVARTLTAVDDLPGPEAFRPQPGELRLSRAELLAATGLDEAQLVVVEQYGLLAPQAAGHYDGDALAIAQSVAAMAGFGIEPRHLRSFKTAADREVGLVEQVVSPLARGRTAEARSRADDAVSELAALSVRLHAALVRSGLRAATGR